MSQTVKINKCDLYYEIHGQGYPLLVLHGYTGSGEDLIPLFKDFVEDYQLIIPDMRGHGRSTNPGKEFTFRQVADDMVKMIDHLKINEFSAIGFSGGGCALLHMALLRPEQLKAMAIVSATHYYPEQVREIMKSFTEESATEASWKEMRSVHKHGDEQIRFFWQNSKAMSESNDDMNLTPADLAKVQAKTLIVQGDRDPLYPLELSVEMYRSMPNASLWIIPEGGHVPVAGEWVKIFLDKVRSFLCKPVLE